MEKIQSKRDREMLVNDGYMYIFDKFSADKQKKFWRCRQKNDCLARIHTSIDNLTILKKSENLHTHGSDAVKVETQIAITNIKNGHCPRWNKHHALSMNVHQVYHKRQRY